MRNIILTENQLHKVIKESVQRVLREGNMDNLSPDSNSILHSINGLNDRQYYPEEFLRKKAKEITDNIHVFAKVTNGDPRFDGLSELTEDDIYEYLMNYYGNRVNYRKY